MKLETERVNDEETSLFLDNLISKMETNILTQVMLNRECIEKRIPYFIDHSNQFLELAKVYLDFASFLGGPIAIERVHAAVLLYPDISVREQSVYPLKESLEYVKREGDYGLYHSKDYLTIHIKGVRFEVATSLLSAVKKLTHFFDEKYGKQPESMAEEVSVLFGVEE